MSVGSPERLVFEGQPDLSPELSQDIREAVVHAGGRFEIKKSFLKISDGEEAEIKVAKDRGRTDVTEESEKARSEWSAARVHRLVENGTGAREARSIINQWLDDRQLTGEFELHFADEQLGAVTVAEVLAEPDNYLGEYLFDLFEDPNDPNTRHDRTQL